MNRAQRRNADKLKRKLDVGESRSLYTYKDWWFMPGWLHQALVGYVNKRITAIE